MNSNKTLEELEKIYGAKKNSRNKEDTNFDRLRISDDEFNNHGLNSEKNTQMLQKDLEAFEEAVHSRKKDEFNEIKSFLPTSAGKVMSTRYESPLKSMKLAAIRWKILTIVLIIFSLMYLLVHTWALLTQLNLTVLSYSPKIILEMTLRIDEMKDVLFDSYRANTIIDFWAMAICLILLVSLLKDNLTPIELHSDVREGKLENMFSRLIYWIIVIFALSYIIGTLNVLYAVHNYATSGGMAVLVIFHLSKMVYLIFNLITFKKYRARKLIYEDLLLEALGNSNSGEEESQEEENHREFFHNTFTAQS